MLFASLATFASLSLLSKGYWNTFRPELKIVDLAIDGERNNPMGELNILHLTDIHIENLSVSSDKVKKMIKDETFDLIALTGDYVDRLSSIHSFLDFLKGIMEIPTRFGVYAVWGNHDWLLKKDGLNILKEKMEALGVVVLENEAKTIFKDNTPIHLIGIDDHYSGHSDVHRAFRHVPGVGLRLILTHDPLVVNQMNYTFDYLISGHFHSGQIHYPIPFHSLKMGLKPFKKYLSGLQYHPNGTYYISGGLGQTGLTFRLGCRPEITIHRLHPKTKRIAA